MAELGIWIKYIPMTPKGRGLSKATPYGCKLCFSVAQHPHNPLLMYINMSETDWCEDCEQPMISNGENETFECLNCGCWISWDAYYEEKAFRWGRL